MSDWYGFGDEPDEDEEGGGVSPSPTIIQKAVVPTVPPEPPEAPIGAMFLNKYRHCNDQWEDVWESKCDSECPCCGASVQPYESEEIVS